MKKKKGTKIAKKAICYDLLQNNLKNAAQPPPPTFKTPGSATVIPVDALSNR